MSAVVGIFHGKLRQERREITHRLAGAIRKSAHLRAGLTLVEAEPATTAWFGIRLDQSTFGIFDAFPDEAGRSAHLSGRLAAALGEKASELLAKPPTIERVDVLAVKLPH